MRWPADLAYPTDVVLGSITALRPSAGSSYDEGPNGCWVLVFGLLGD